MFKALRDDFSATDLVAAKIFYVDSFQTPFFFLVSGFQEGQVDDDQAGAQTY